MIEDEDEDDLELDIPPAPVPSPPPAPAPAPVAARKYSPAELSGYRACIECLDTLSTAMNGIPHTRRDPELVAIMKHWNEAAPSVRKRFERMSAR